MKHYFTREDAEDEKLIIQMINETKPSFIKWGIQAVLNWRNERMPESLYHIHGTGDEMFPYANTSPTHTILKGDHVLVITYAEEVNKMLTEIFSNISDTHKTT